MNLERFTQKSRAALEQAAQQAASAGHPEVTPEHLLHALLTQEQGIVPAILSKTGSDVQDLITLTARELEKLPSVKGGASPGLGRRLAKGLERAQKAAEVAADVRHGVVSPEEQHDRSLRARSDPRSGHPEQL